MENNIEIIKNEEMFIDSQLTNSGQSLIAKLIMHSLRGIKQVGHELNIDINDLNVINIIDYFKKQNQDGK
jgi:hypothetical protein